MKSGPIENRTRPVEIRKGRFAGPASSCWTMGPIAGVGIEPTISWVRARCCYQQQPPRSVVSKQRLAFRKKVRGEGFEPSSPASKAGSLPLADPRSLQNALWELNPPVQLGRLAPLPLGQGHVISQSGRRGSRTLKAVTLDRLRTGCHRQLACPSVKLRRQESNLCPGG